VSGGPSRAKPARDPAPKPVRSREAVQSAQGVASSWRTQRKEGVSLQHITTCPECAGRGSIIDAPCPECGGNGQVLREETLTLRIPVGVEEGMALRVPGHGQPAEKPGLPPGDLYVIISGLHDPRFERHGRDLYRTETIDVVDAVLGASLDVPTLERQVSTDVPAGTQPDSILRLRGTDPFQPPNR
jgi:molecular chaperone DnaJ